jgi:preprotein translocase subunit SecE
MAGAGLQVEAGFYNKAKLMSVETSSGRFDTVKWVVVAVLVAVAVVGNSYFADQSLLYRVLGIVALAAVAGLVALQTAKGAAFWTLVKGARTEIRKVVWPTRQETVQTTMIVVAFVVLVALLLWGLDSFLGWLVSLAIA